MTPPPNRPQGHACAQLFIKILYSIKLSLILFLGENSGYNLEIFQNILLI
jgi:hypothetical protein